MITPMPKTDAKFIELQNVKVGDYVTTESFFSKRVLGVRHFNGTAVKLEFEAGSWYQSNPNELIWTEMRTV